MGSIGKFELIMFLGDTKLKRMLRGDTGKERGKIKIQHTIDGVSTVRHVYLKVRERVFDIDPPGDML